MNNYPSLIPHVLALLSQVVHVDLYHVQIASYETLKPTTMGGICITSYFAQSIDNGEDASVIVCVSPQNGPAIV